MTEDPKTPTVRIYIVSSSGTDRLIEASSQAQALRHVVTPLFTVRSPSTTEVARLMTAGVKLEQAGGAT